MTMITAIIVAAGQGTRFARAIPEDAPNSGIPKQLIPLCGKPLYLRSVERLSNMQEIDSLVIVTSEDLIPRIERDVQAVSSLKPTSVIKGGALRQDSVWEGLSNVHPSTEIVVVHDAARPFPPAEPTSKAIAIAYESGAAILALQTTDTIKITPVREKSSEGYISRVERTIERNRVWRAQTPQVFRRELLMDAYRYVRKNAITITDEAQAVELFEHEVYIVPGTYTNLKITTPHDLSLAETYCARSG